MNLLEGDAGFEGDAAEPLVHCENSVEPRQIDDYSIAHRHPRAETPVAASAYGIYGGLVEVCDS